MTALPWAPSGAEAPLLQYAPTSTGGHGRTTPGTAKRGVRKERPPSKNPGSAAPLVPPSWLHPWDLSERGWFGNTACCCGISHGDSASPSDALSGVSRRQGVGRGVAGSLLRHPQKIEGGPRDLAAAAGGRGHPAPTHPAAPFLLGGKRIFLLRTPHPYRADGIKKG